MRVLVFAPHPDDEILGCGGVMAKHIAAGDEVYVAIVTGSKAEQARLINEAYARKAHAFLGVKETFFFNFPPVELPLIQKREFNAPFAELVKSLRPDTVYMPFYGDMHADHAVVAEAVMVAVRPPEAPWIKAVYMYETLSETGWHYPTAEKAFLPNVFADISDHIEKKVQALCLYETKLKPDPHPRSPEGIHALAKYRGGTMGVSYAEAFMCVRIRL